MTLSVNIIARLLMALALLLLLLLVNDREVMGDLANCWRANFGGPDHGVGITLVGALDGIITLFPDLLGK
jgi:hypothetical protein